MDEFGLINMNGRVYDSSVGRFLSPDNAVQAPDNSQSYNRYAYCLNNPLKYTDPTGYLWYRDNWGQWNYWDEPGSNDKDIDPSTLTSEEYTLSPTDRVLVCGFWNNGKFKLSDSFSYFNLYAVSLTKEGKEHKKEEEAAKQAAKDKTNTKSVAEKRKEDIAKLKAKNGGARPSYTPPPKDMQGFPGAERVKPKGGRPRWKLPNGDLGEWDGQHGEVEVYNRTGKTHKGAWDPEGNQTKDPDPGRHIDPLTVQKLGVTITVGIIFYEVVKWSAAGVLAPETFGGSLGAAAMLP